MRLERRPIAILPRLVAEGIAAGEVIERPASVVRELLDNAVDAGARQVTVELRGGGLELIRVSDDGSGIPTEEVELAFCHHATSKIATLDDLLQLRTLGFRGEALPSIAAIAEVEMFTRAPADPYGTIVVLRAGEVVRRARAARQPGTTVSVRQLFYNVPVRRGFLANRRSESLLIGQLVRRYALAHPAIRFSLLLDGRLTFRSSGGGRLDLAMAEVHGPAVGAGLLALPAIRQETFSLGGFLGGRALTRPSRDQITLIINQRCATSRGLLAALENAYRPFLPRGRHPIGVIVIEVPPSEVDPNVHPAKIEVRLRREPEIATALAAAVRTTLERAPARPSPTDELTFGPAQYPLPLASRCFAESGEASPDRAIEDARGQEGMLSQARVLGQLQQSLILVEHDDGLLLIDQHRAHERILYETLRRDEGTGLEAQTLLEPVVVELAPHQAERLDERLAMLDELGFQCQRIGGRAYLIQTVPLVPGQEQVVAQLASVIEEAAAPEDGWRERLLAALACRAAIRRHRPLDLPEMERLVRELARTSAPAVCPHGSPLILQLTRRFLERQLGW